MCYLKYLIQRYIILQLSKNEWKVTKSIKAFQNPLYLFFINKVFKHAFYSTTPRETMWIHNQKYFKMIANKFTTYTMVLEMHVAFDSFKKIFQNVKLYVATCYAYKQIEAVWFAYFCFPASKSHLCHCVISKMKAGCYIMVLYERFYTPTITKVTHDIIISNISVFKYKDGFKTNYLNANTFLVYQDAFQNYLECILTLSFAFQIHHAQSKSHPCATIIAFYDFYNKLVGPMFLEATNY